MFVYRLVTSIETRIEFSTTFVVSMKSVKSVVPLRYDFWDLAIGWRRLSTNKWWDSFCWSFAAWFYRSPNRGSGAPNDCCLGNICSEPSRMPKIFDSPRTAKNFEHVSWWLFVGLRVSGFMWFVHLRISDFVIISRFWFRHLEIS